MALACCLTLLPFFYVQIDAFKLLSNFCKRCRDIWGSVRHSPSAIFKRHSKEHNKGRHVGFIKPSECRMAGEHIALLRLLRLKDALRSTIASKEFIDLKLFRSEAAILASDAFWKYLFVMCRALYAPMRILRLADQKTPAMDKLYYYVLQTDKQLPKWMKIAEDHGYELLTDPVLEVMRGDSFTRIDPIIDVSVDDDDDGDDEDDDDDEDDEDEDDNEDAGQESGGIMSDTSDGVLDVETQNNGYVLICITLFFRSCCRVLSH